MKRWTKRAFWLIAAIAIAVMLGRAFRTPPVMVDVATVRRAALTVTIDDDGHTRVRERYTICAPIDGCLLRLPLEAGAPLRAGETLVAELRAAPPRPLDARAGAEAAARIASARAAVQQAGAERARVEADVVFTSNDLARRRELLATGSEAGLDLERAERDARHADAARRAAEFAMQVAEHELQLAEASALATSTKSDDELTPIVIRSPIDGHVLRVFEASARVLTAGTPILEVGDTNAIEVVGDFLSQDAVLVRPGMPVLVHGFAGTEGEERAAPLRGEVRLVEPSGYTKVSALGVEEQRVDILIDPREPIADWRALQDGYRVELSIVTWSHDDVLLVPTGALFRDGTDWAVFVVTDGLARQRRVTLGRRSDLDAEVRDGLNAGDRVVLYPSELVSEGVAVEAR